MHVHNNNRTVITEFKMYTSAEKKKHRGECFMHTDAQAALRLVLNVVNLRV